MSSALIKFANNNWSKIGAFIGLPLSMFSLGKTNNGSLDILMGVLGCSSLVTLGTALFASEIEANASMKVADTNLFTQIKTTFPLDANFNYWFSSIDYGMRSFPAQYLEELHLLADTGYFDREYEFFHDKNINTNFNKFNKSMLDFLNILSGYTTSTGTGIIVGVNREMNEETYNERVKELNDGAIAIWRNYVNLHKIAKERLHI